MAHQDVAEDELVLILHIQAPALYGLQDAIQAGAATESADQGANATSGDDNVVDADYNVVDDENK